MDAFVETEDGFDEHVLKDTNSTVISQPQLLLRIGGLLVAALALIYFLLKKYHGSTSTRITEVISTDEELRRRAAIESARLKLQERFNEDVLRYKAKQEELKKLQAQRKAEEWESMMSGTSCPLKQTKTPKSGDTDDGEGQQPQRRPKPKVCLRDDFNPLTGGASGSRYRPTPRFGAGGG